MSDQTNGWRPNGRPTSVVVMNFSADLDNIFNLGETGELAFNVEAKKHEVKNSERQLQTIEQQLRQAEERLKRLESKHRRMQSENILNTRPNRRQQSREQYTSSDSDERGYSDDQNSPSS